MSELLLPIFSDHRFTQRHLVYALVGSVLLHILLVLGFALYQAMRPEMLLTLPSGTPDFPVRTQWVMITQYKTPEVAPIAKKEDIITTSNANEHAKTQAQPHAAKPHSQMTPDLSKDNKTPQKSASENSVASAKEPALAIGVHRNLPVYTEPRYRVPPQAPVYPLSARRRGQEGDVLLYVLVEPNGQTREVSVQRTSGYTALDQAAKRAVAKWQIIPYQLNGKAQRAFYQVLVKFELQ